MLTKINTGLSQVKNPNIELNLPHGTYYGTAVSLNKYKVLEFKKYLKSHSDRAFTKKY